MGHESGLVMEEEGKGEEGKGEEGVVIHHNPTTTTTTTVVVVVVIIHHTDQDRSTLITNHPHLTVVTVNSMVMRTHRAQG